MPLDSLELRASLQRVLSGLILILVPLTVFGFYVACSLVASSTSGPESATPAGAAAEGSAIGDPPLSTTQR